MDQIRNLDTEFFKSIASPIVIYTDSELKDKISNLRHPFPIEIIVLDNIWDLMEELEKERNRFYLDNYFNVQHRIDRENEIHNADLYAIWNLKSYMTKKVADRNPFNSSLFIYADAGGWREGITPDWPNILYATHLKRILKDRVLFGQINPVEENPESDWVDIIEGGFFAGSKIAINSFFDSFWNIHDELMDKGKFIGKDQKMMQIYALVRNKKQVVRLKTWDLNCTKTLDQWFFFINFLAFDSQYFCQNNRDSLLINL